MSKKLFSYCARHLKARYYVRFLGKKGFSMLEIVVYVSLFTVISGITLTGMVQMAKSFNDLRSARDIDDSALQILSRLTRDIKSTDMVNFTQSDFSTDPGKLTLLTMTASGTPMKITYQVVDGKLHVIENLVDKGSLNSQYTNIDGLVFTYINTPKSHGIKIALQISSTQDKAHTVQNFYSTALLRGSYYTPDTVNGTGWMSGGGSGGPGGGGLGGGGSGILGVGGGTGGATGCTGTLDTQVVDLFYDQAPTPAQPCTPVVSTPPTPLPTPTPGGIIFTPVPAPAPVPAPGVSPGLI
jgi:hypothetical protein